MAVEFKTSMTKAELLEAAVVNGVAADGGMTKAQIIDALEKHNAAEREAEAAAIAAQNGAGGAEASGESNDTTPEENAAQSAAEGAENAAAAEGQNSAAAEAVALAAQEGAEGAEASGDETTQPGGEQPAEGAQDGAEDHPEGYGLFVYAGPSIPRGRLKENSVFRGTLADVKAYLADVLEEYPQAERLIVPAQKLAAFSARVKTPGNIAHKYYNDIVSAMHGNKEV